MDNEKVILIGGFHEIIELLDLCSIDVAGIVDNSLKGEYYGKKVICSDSEISHYKNELRKYPLLLTPDKPEIREKLYKYYSNYNFTFRNIISPKADISKSSKIANGAIIQSGVNVSSNTSISRFVKVNTHANIMHDVIIGEFTTIAPNAVILGNVKIGKRTYIGANATILPDITIGDDVIVGAGSVVTKNIESNSIVKGVPAK